MTNVGDWQDTTGRTWAAMYAQTDRMFAGLTQHLLGRSGLLPGEALLDVGCGAGELSLATARARPRAKVVGVDVSRDLILAAQERSGERENPQFVLGDAANWTLPGFNPDLIVSRHGVMFFDDPPAAFGHLATIAAPGARMAFSCFRSPRENRWATDLSEMIGLLPADPFAPGPFAFADPQRVESILADGGWHDVDLEPVDFAYVAGMGEDPVAEARRMFERIGPAAAPLRMLTGSARQELDTKLTAWLEKHRNGGLVAFAAGAWIVTARRR